MKNIPIESKILSISHNDLDGTVAQIILGNVFKNISYLNASFYKIDDIMRSIQYQKYDFVFITDINPTDISLLNLSDNIILLDHHGSAFEANNPSKMHYVITNHCAAYLTKNFVEKYYNIKLRHLDNIVRLTDDYDLWNLKYPESKLLNDLMFYKYRPKKFRELFFDGRTTFTEEENKWLKMREKEFETRYQSLTAFDCEHINGCVVQSDQFINEICDRLMKEDGYNIVFCRNPNHGRVSIRHNLPNLNVGELLKNKGFGGGHAQSAGLFVEDIYDFQMKIKILDEEISQILKNS